MSAAFSLSRALGTPANLDMVHIIRLTVCIF